MRFPARLFSLLLILLLSKTAVGSHSMGSDLTYQCLGGNSYEITLSFYRDCAGIDADTGAFIVFQSSCFQADSVEIFQIAGTGQEISPACAAQATTCNGGTFTGIQEYIYRGIITLPGPCADWNISYNLCCRNAAITNIQDPSNTQMYIYATLDNTNGLCNNSPVFSNKPVPFVCLGQQFCFNHGAYDSEGDSLVYQLITPYDRAGTPVTYLAPFTSNQPLSSSPAMSFNPQTGDICMTPTNLEVTVMAVLVKEYRNGVLIGSVERDIQVTVITCSNIIPTLTGINGTNSFAMTICAGEQTCFDVFSSDVDAGQNTFVTWDYAIPGADFTAHPAPRETGTFCWTPTQADVNVIPYCFTVTVRDDNCPYTGSQIYSFCITVRGLDVDAGPDANVVCNSFATLTASAYGGSGAYTYQWNTGQTTTAITAGAGGYTVTASEGPCSNSDTVNVTPANGAPQAGFSIAQTCTSLAVGFTDQSTIVGGTITSWSWNFGDGGTSAAQSPTHTYAATGTYTVMLIVQTATGCIDTVRQSLLLSNNRPTAAFTTTNVCFGEQANFDDGSASNITLWDWDFGDGNGSNVPSPAHTYNASGNYVVTLSVTNADGCTSTTTRPITIYTLPTANAGPNDTICRGSVATLTASGGVSYAWYPGGGTTATFSVSPTSTQDFYVVVTDARGCTDRDSARVILRRSPNVSAGNTRRICLGDTTTLSAQANGSQPLTYLWTPGNLATQQIQVHPNTTTNYYLTVRDSYSCPGYDTVQVIVNPLPTAATNPNQLICPGDSALLIASGGINYSWSGGGNNDSIYVSPLTNTTYTVTVADTNGCEDTEDILVTVSAPATANLGPDRTICAGSSVSLSVGNGVAWLWNPGGQTTSSVSVDPLVTTDYTIRVTNFAGCLAWDTIRVNVNDPPVIAAQVLGDVACFGGADGQAMVAVNAGTPPFRYFWSGGGTNDTLSGIRAGTFQVAVTDSNGCISRDSVTILEPAALSLAADALPVSCYGGDNGSVTLTAGGGTPVYAVTWNVPGQSGLVLDSMSAGNYSATLTDANGCTITTSATIAAPDSITLQVIATNPRCYGSPDGSLIALAGGGTGAITYVWSPGTVDRDSLLDVPAGTYVLLLTDANDCTRLDTFVIGQPDSIALQPLATPITCTGSRDGSVEVHPTGGTPGYQFQWMPGNATDSVVTNLDTGSYRVVVTDANGCRDSVDMIVNDANPVSLTVAGPPVICTGQTATLLATAIGTRPPYSFTWSDGSTLDSLVVQPTDTARYEVYVTDSAGCRGEPVAITVNVYPPLDLSLDALPAICAGDSVLLHAVAGGGNGGPYSYNWNNGAVLTDEAMAYPVTDSSFVVRVSDGCSPDVLDSVPVTVYPLPVVEFTPISSSGCAPVAVNFDNLIEPPLGSTYAWNFGDDSTSTVPDPAHVYTEPGVYDVSLAITSDFGCENRLRIDSAVVVYAWPVADFDQSAATLSIFTPLLELFDRSDLSASWQWDYGDGTVDTGVVNPQHQYADTGTYQIRLFVQSPGGCPDTAYGTVRIDQELTLYIPNAFTPNGDGKNDGFIAVGIGVMEYEMWIIDRWGREIYHSTSFEQPWDGSYKGGNPTCQADVYEYVIQLRDIKDRRHKYIGHVTLVR